MARTLVMDYKELLTKFLEYVYDVEGIDVYIFDERCLVDSEITDDEWRELESLQRTTLGKRRLDSVAERD